MYIYICVCVCVYAWYDICTYIFEKMEDATTQTCFLFVCTKV